MSKVGSRTGQPRQSYWFLFSHSLTAPRKSLGVRPRCLQQLRRSNSTLVQKQQKRKVTQNRYKALQQSRHTAPTAQTATESPCSSRCRCQRSQSKQKRRSCERKVGETWRKHRNRAGKSAEHTTRAAKASQRSQAECVRAVLSNVKSEKGKKN